MRHLKIKSLLFVLFLASCKSKEEYIKKHGWKYMEGYHISDWIDFKNTGVFKLRHDTIFESNKAVATIQNSSKNSLGGSGKIIIKSLLTDEIGTYTEK